MRTLLSQRDQRLRADHEPAFISSWQTGCPAGSTCKPRAGQSMSPSAPVCPSLLREGGSTPGVSLAHPSAPSSGICLCTRISHRPGFVEKRQQPVRGEQAGPESHATAVEGTHTRRTEGTCTGAHRSPMNARVPVRLKAGPQPLACHAQEMLGKENKHGPVLKESIG